MGTQFSCLHLKNASSSTSNPSNTSSGEGQSHNHTAPPQMSMTFEIYTPRPIPTTLQSYPSENITESAESAQGHTNSVTRSESASGNERRRTNRRFSFSESVHQHQEEGVSMSQVTVTEGSRNPNSNNRRSRFPFASAFSWRPSKNLEFVSSPVGKLHIDAKPEPSMLSYVETTPKGADAVRFPHFCPICYRHFADIYRTNCCGHNICYSCSQRHIESKRKLAKKDRIEPASTTRATQQLDVHIPCPNCNSDNVTFERTRKGDKSRIYCESPTTRQLMERSKQHLQPQSSPSTTYDLSHFHCPPVPSAIQV